MNKKINEFPVTIYGQIEKYNDVLSKARCRIFYRGGNRNGTFITDEFAEKLLSSLAYVPVKGIYEDGDFTDHGEDRAQGQIYGIVPQDPNWAWEKFIDDSGFEREYACADVLLFTALYPESSQIVGKCESMELYGPSIKYHWSFIQGQKWLVFEEGCFLGLQVLGSKDGEKVEPCFEGAAFYNLQQSIASTINEIENYAHEGGQEEMKVEFRLSDEDKRMALMSLINPNFNEDGGWALDYWMCAVYEDYALVQNAETLAYERVYYKKNDEENSVEITERVPVFVLDVTENELNTIKTLRRLNGETYDLVSENLSNADDNAQKVLEQDTKIEELNSTISTLQTEAENKDAELNSINEHYSAAQNQISELNTVVNTLTEYKHAIETQQKEAVIADYADKLSEDVLEQYRAKLDEYSVLDLDKDLAYELKKLNVNAFSVHAEDIIPKDIPLGGIEGILSKYKKK